MHQTRMARQGQKRSFTSVMALDQLELSHVPLRYVLPPSDRPTKPSPVSEPSTVLPVIDLSSLQHPSLRSQTICDIRMACKDYGCFQVINHGIPQSILKDALDVSMEFFNLSMEEKMLLGSDNVHEPVRYGTSLNHVKDQIHFWRDFLKHYSNPLSNWIHLWPSNPPTYKDKMGKYAKAMHELQKQVIDVVLQSLGLKGNYLGKEIEEGSQVMAVNYYPACPEPELALGLPPHSDYGSLTIILQSCQGLEHMDHDKTWSPAPAVEGALIVQVGDQVEVLSNGQYKSVVHRATVSAEKARVSIASLHSLALDEKMGPAPKLVDEKRPKSYREFSFREFLDFMSNNDIMKGRFIDTLKTNP